MGRKCGVNHTGRQASAEGRRRESRTLAIARGIAVSAFGRSVTRWSQPTSGAAVRRSTEWWISRRLWLSAHVRAAMMRAWRSRERLTEGHGLTDIALEAIGSVVMLMAPAYLVLQPWALLRLKGRWRIAAAAPLLIAIPTALWSLYALSHESNLWPITFILFSPLGTIYLCALLLAHRYS
jgi:hypothetical protein